jgi:hypothetical protein
MRFCLINILLFFTLNSYAQNISVKAYLDSNNIKIGSQAILSLEIEKTKNLETRFPFLTDTIIKQIEIIRKFPVDTLVNKDNLLKLRQKYLITSFDSGVYLIPTFNFLAKKDSLTDTLKSSPMTLTVVSIPVDTVKKQIRDIKVPYSASITLIEIITYILYFIIAAILVLVIIYVVKRYRKNEPLIKLPEKPKEPAYVIALRELDKLKNEKLWQQDKIKQYHSDLTEIIRKYIENRFDIMALEQTSYEILNSFSNSGIITNSSFEELKYMLFLADLVKFAKAQPLPDENDLSMRNAYSFVNETKDVPTLINQTTVIESDNKEIKKLES